MTDNEKLEPIFIDKDQLSKGVNLIGKIEASDAVIETGCQGARPLIILHELVRTAIFNKAHQQYGTEQQLFLISTSYEIEPYFGGLIGSARCDVYSVPNYIPEPFAHDPIALDYAKKLLDGKAHGTTVMNWKKMT